MAIGKSHSFVGRTVDGSSIYRIPENLIVPYEFRNLPLNDFGPRWTEDPPIGWGQYGPYYNLFNKVYLRRDGTLETIANGGGNVHSMKAFGLGTSVGITPAENLKNIIMEEVWSVPRIGYSVNIPEDKTYVNFGCFYKVPANDRLRAGNFGAIYLHFNVTESLGRNSSYFNFYMIGGEDITDTFPGNIFPDYLYLNDYGVPPWEWQAKYQWIGQDVIKLRQLGLVNQSSATDDWQFLNFKVEIPTFSTTSPSGNDYYNGRPVSCSLALSFGENNAYLDDNSGINSGSVIFYYPFLYFS